MELRKRTQHCILGRQKLKLPSNWTPKRYSFYQAQFSTWFKVLGRSRLQDSIQTVWVVIINQKIHKCIGNMYWTTNMWWRSGWQCMHGDNDDCSWVTNNVDMETFSHAKTAQYWSRFRVILFIWLKSLQRLVIFYCPLRAFTDRPTRRWVRVVWWREERDITVFLTTILSLLRWLIWPINYLLFSTDWCAILFFNYYWINSMTIVQRDTIQLAWMAQINSMSSGQQCALAVLLCQRRGVSN